MRRLVCCFCLFLLGVTVAAAQVPRLINYQGSPLQDDFLVDGSLEITFALYEQSAGGSALWTESRDAVTVSDGRFSVLLGEESSFPDGLFADQSALYLEVEVEGETLPRLRLASTAFALRAETAGGVVAGGVTAEALADGAVESDALAPGAVTTAAIANDAVTDEDIAASAVRSQELANGAVVNAKIADDAISSSKLRAGSVTREALVDASVATSKIADGAVQRNKIAPDAAVRSLNDLSDQVTLEGGNNVSVFTDATNGIITISAGFSFGQPSSRRWKTHIRPLEDAIALVEQLRGVRYTWTEDGRADVGLIAEDVGTVIPEVVTYEDDGVDARTVNYGKLVAVLVEAIKEQQRELNGWKQEAASLSERVARLERLVEQQVAGGAASNQRP